MPPISWLVVGSLLSGIVSLGFIRYLWPYRNRLGGRFFIATIACEALWSLSYGVALLVFDPGLRELFEIPIWLAVNFIGVFFLAFALEYTGRGSLLRSKLMGSVVGLQVLHTLIVVTNPLHQVAWSNYQVEPLYGAATVTYAHQPWLFVNAIGFTLMVGIASVLLADTVFSYGPLYRTQAAAIALSPIFPGLPFLLWLVEVPSSPPLNLTPLLFPIHLAFDMYAFFSRDMFELVPAARRVADRASLDNLGTPVVILDSDDRIIELNREAARLLDTTPGDALGDPLGEHLPEVDPRETGQTISLMQEGRRREFTVTTGPLEDARGTDVGSTIVFQDITAERQREQRLAVLNRVLRHNLRNDLNVVKGYVGIARDRIEDPDVRDKLDTAHAKTEAVLDLGETARAIEHALDTDATTAAIDLSGILDEIVSDLTDQYPDATIDVDVPRDLELSGNSLAVRGVFTELLENALEHADTRTLGASVQYLGREDGTGRAIIEVRDDGPGIPEMELDVLTTDRETALEHGSGLGLWFVEWGVGSLGGSIDFEITDDGTTAHLRLPTT